jgi:predicted heme/steroid binding protein
MSKQERSNWNLLEGAAQTFTLDELTRFDGRNGAPAYVAIHGKVYDITRVPLFRDGKHHGVTPGNDVTEFFVHKSNILNRLNIVGELK